MQVEQNGSSQASQRPMQLEQYELLQRLQADSHSLHSSELHRLHVYASSSSTA